MRDTSRSSVTRRGALALGAGAAAATLSPLGTAAQQPPSSRFGHEEVVRRARELAAKPYDAGVRELPPELRNLSFDQYRNIVFRSDRALFGADGGPFRLHLFHPGFLFARTVTVNTVRDGIPAPAPYSNALFDYGGINLARPLPVDLGFAGFKLNYPLNDPRNFDELISFVGSSYFRVLGRHEVYGLSARGAAINYGGPPGQEEFPFFREFWIENPGRNADRAVIEALMDSESLTGAFRFEVYPGDDTKVEITATIIPRKPIGKLGLAPLTSMFFYGETTRRNFTDYRPELHDSDGLLMLTGAGEWIWRPLVNPDVVESSRFIDRNPRGFGLIQRDRNFEHYQDLDLNYEARPSYWIEPRGAWGEGELELFAFPTRDETNDNVVLCWIPKAPVEPGREIEIGYRLTVLSSDAAINVGGRAINTFTAPAAALGAAEGPGEGTQRFLIDFAGGDLGYYVKDPGRVSVTASVSSGQVTRTFVTPNPKIKGFRAAVDVKAEKGQTVDIRAFLRAGERTLTETWTMPFRRGEA